MGVGQQNELQRIKDMIEEKREEFESRHRVQIMSSGLGRDIWIHVRPTEDVERPISESALDEMRKHLFELADKEFPLRLTVLSCCEQPADITGKITKIEEKRALIVDETKKNGNTDDPEATWVSMNPDGKLVRGGESIRFEDLKVGQQVQAWSTGLMLQSYPGQTSAVKLEVLREK
jgi:hypothetical protein